MTGLVAAPIRVTEPPTDDLTQVELVWIEKQTEHWIRFGRNVREQILDRRRRILFFPPGAVFGLVRWASNEHGTVLSRLDIVRAIAPGQPLQTVPTVRPGGEVLLRAESWPKVERVLQIIDGIEASGVDPMDVAPDHWRHVHNRLAVGEAPRVYSLRRHRAFLLRQEIGA